jgi:hypothetical protein
VFGARVNAPSSGPSNLFSQIDVATATLCSTLKHSVSPGYASRIVAMTLLSSSLVDEGDCKFPQGMLAEKRRELRELAELRLKEKR